MTRSLINQLISLERTANRVGVAHPFFLVLGHGTRTPPNRCPPRREPVGAWSGLVGCRPFSRVWRGRLMPTGVGGANVPGSFLRAGGGAIEELGIDTLGGERRDADRAGLDRTQTNFGSKATPTQPHISRPLRVRVPLVQPCSHAMARWGKQPRWHNANVPAPRVTVVILFRGVTRTFR